MSYKAVDIKDRVAVGDDCFQLIKLSDGRYRLVPAPDSVTEVGTNVDRALLYPMSQELERLSEGLPDATTADEGKALIVNAEGKYELGEAGAADAVRYTAQTLTEAQKAQALENIGMPAPSVENAGKVPVVQEDGTYALGEGGGDRIANITYGMAKLQAGVSELEEGEVYLMYE